MLDFIFFIYKRKNIRISHLVLKKKIVEILEVDQQFNITVL